MNREEPEERRNRELGELLEELRVILPGAEVLFAFLLTLPFTPRFSAMNPLQRHVYFAVFLCTAAAVALLIAPSSHHRLLWHRRPAAKERGLETASRLAVAGIGLLALAMVGVVFVITDMLFGSAVSAIIAALAGGLFGWLWYGWPLLQRLRYQAADRPRQAPAGDD